MTPWIRASGLMLARTELMFSKSLITASRAFRPFHGVIWCVGAPLKEYLAPTMFRQQDPKPLAGRDVTFDEWLRMRTSAPSNTCASCITVFAFGGIISSPGAPYTTTLPGAFARARYSDIAIAAARPTGPCA